MENIKCEFCPSKNYNMAAQTVKKYLGNGIIKHDYVFFLCNECLKVKRENKDFDSMYSMQKYEYVKNQVRKIRNLI